MMMRRVAAASSSLVPPWLEPLLTTPFFATCASHADAARSECNMYCIDCSGAGGGDGGSAAFCFYCRSDRHSGHRVIQIRRSSYHDVVRVSEIQKVLDISCVQTYVINSARVLFLNERPQPRGSGSAAGRSGGGASSSSSSAHACEICARALLDPFRFCSLGCKLVGIKRNGDTCFVLDDGDGGGDGGGGGGGGGETSAAEETRRRGSREGSGHDTRLHTPSPPPNSRRRKGVPHRAPFAS